MDTKSEKLKFIILQQYPSVRLFAREIGIPHGTLVSALNNGIDGMAWGRLNLICERLKINPVNLEPIGRDNGEITEREKRLLAYYNLLNENGQTKVEEYLKDIVRIAIYANQDANLTKEK